MPSDVELPAAVFAFAFVPEDADAPSAGAVTVDSEPAGTTGSLLPPHPETARPSITEHATRLPEIRSGVIEREASMKVSSESEVAYRGRPAD